MGVGFDTKTYSWNYPELFHMVGMADCPARKHVQWIVEP
jgi:hypothetical protein